MQSNYKLFKKLFPVIIFELLLTIIFSTLSFSFLFDNKTGTLSFKNILSLTCAFLIAVTLATVLYFAFRIKDMRAVKLKKDYEFPMFASCFAALMSIILFVYRFVQVAVYPGEFNFWRVTHFLLTLPLIAHFVVLSIPKKIKRKRINIPKQLKNTLSIVAVIWAVFGIFSIYFYEFLPMKNVFKTSQIIMYACFALFFLFEAEFEIIKPRYRAYIISAFLCAIMSTAFSLGAIIPKALAIVTAESSISEIEILCSASIGIYAISRIYALFKTEKYIIDEEKDTSRHHHHRHHHSKAQENKPVTEEKAENE